MLLQPYAGQIVTMCVVVSIRTASFGLKHGVCATFTEMHIEHVAGNLVCTLFHMHFEARDGIPTVHLVRNLTKGGIIALHVYALDCDQACDGCELLLGDKTAYNDTR